MQFYQKYIDFNDVSGGAQVLTRDAQIQGVMFTSNNALVPANLNVFCESTQNPFGRQHFGKPRDFNTSVGESPAA